MYQVIQAALNDEKDKTRFTLLFANVAEEDILLRKELEGLQAKNPSRFKINYTLDRPSATWKGFKGHVTDKIYKESGLPTATDEKSIVFVCGPPGFMKVSKILRRINA